MYTLSQLASLANIFLLFDDIACIFLEIFKVYFVLNMISIVKIVILCLIYIRKVLEYPNNSAKNVLMNAFPGSSGRKQT